MGEVAPLRSQSLYHAVAAAADELAPPVLVLSMPASPLVLAGRDAAPDRAEIDSCRELGVPLLPWPGEGFRRLERGRLLFQLIVAAEAAGAPGWPASTVPGGTFIELVALACRRAGLAPATAAGREVRSGERVVATAETCALAGSVVAIGDLAGPAGGRGEPQPAVLAEALVSTLETAMCVEFAPSLPTPEELEAIYLNDEVLAREERSGLGRARAASGHPA